MRLRRTEHSSPSAGHTRSGRRRTPFSAPPLLRSSWASRCLALREAVAHFPGRRGKPALRTAVELLNDRAESRRESLLRVVLVQAGMPGLVVNLPITTSGGYHYRADLAFPAGKVVIEYQSEYHGDEAQRRMDMTRRARLEADGWYVREVNADDLRDPSELVLRIRRVLAGRHTSPQ